MPAATSRSCSKFPVEYFGNPVLDPMNFLFYFLFEFFALFSRTFFPCFFFEIIRLKIISHGEKASYFLNNGIISEALLVLLRKLLFSSRHHATQELCETDALEHMGSVRHWDNPGK